MSATDYAPPALIAAAQNGSRAAAEELLTRNVGLIRAVVGRFSKRASNNAVLIYGIAGFRIPLFNTRAERENSTHAIIAFLAGSVAMSIERRLKDVGCFDLSGDSVCCENVAQALNVALTVYDKLNIFCVIERGDLTRARVFIKA